MASLQGNSETSPYTPPPTAPALDIPTRGLPEQPVVSELELRQRADAMAQQWQLLLPDNNPHTLKLRLTQFQIRLTALLRLCKTHATSKQLTPQLELLESTRMLEAVLTGLDATSADFARLPQVRNANEPPTSRALNLAEQYLSAAQGIWSPESFTSYVHQTQRLFPLLLAEIRSLPLALKLAQLEFILDRADEAFAAGPLPPIEQSPFSAPLHSLRRLNQFEWSAVLEPLIPYDAVLRHDPCQIFASMDDETRSSYHMRVAELARHADRSEVETAQSAIDLARTASRNPITDPRLHRRLSHVGYYLFAEGLPALSRQIGYHPPPVERIRTIVRRWNNEFYILGIFSLTLLLIVAVILPLVPHHAFWSVMAALLLALLPATQGAVDLVNGSVSALLKAQALPKLDLSKSVPKNDTTLVVVPTLLLHEKQVRELFDALEARYLSNLDPNIHFGLLTDLPDSAAQPPPEDRDPLVQLAVQCTRDLNQKYASHLSGGAFLLLHRHRVFNARQGVWMGWERKRGKLLDLNQLLLHKFDSFPVKAGPLDVLEHVRYVITLDSDTQLPHATAARMIGTLSHPLNQAIVNPRLRVVTAGYGILQPRVGVSVASASRSRLSALYSGETGFDIYTRAISDVYQDLFGEGIFTGKGIYEVSVFHQVLDRRFPRNALLSHDLIEGSYARAGLVTDIEVIDDYPSHYSAHTRRKHRWVRGDWQIARWLFSQVPDESGHLVQNPISTISRWKIFDNLRRSLAEPVTFLVLLLGWFVLPGGALYWTIATIVLLILPGLVQLLFNFSRALLSLSVVAVRASFTTFASSFGFSVLNLTFLPHHMFLSLDAIVRSLIRTLISGKRLLEWETAAQAESHGHRNALDKYLFLSPVVAVVTALGLLLRNPRSLLAAAPVLLLWSVAPLVVLWLNSSPHKQEGPLAPADTAFLQHHALLLWRYFLQFGDQQNHWLIPDNVEEQDTHQVRKLSPTNLGMLFNTRQAAVEMGFLTLPEFAQATLGTLATYDKLQKHRGHIFNWYDIETLQAIPPFTISSVDSGNLSAALYTLHAGVLDLLQRPILTPATFAGLQQMLQLPAPENPSLHHSIHALLHQTPASPPSEDWLATEAENRRRTLTQFLHQYTPWLLPEYEPLFALPEFNQAELQPAKLPQTQSQSQTHPQPTLAAAPNYARTLTQRLTAAARTLPPSSPLAPLLAALQSRLPDAAQHLSQLHSDLATIAREAERHADAMDYAFLFVPSRQLLSIGYDAAADEVLDSCYDLLASEARIATFLAIAKGDIPQQSWFRLDRTHVLVDGRAALVSWTGTMFEYMMPSLWMRNFPDTLISRSLHSAVQIQRRHVRNIPWGISESGFARTDALGRYSYQAWGIPGLALKYGAEDGPVISPYSTFLTLPLLRKEAIANLRRMDDLHWSGAFGFYEAADYIEGPTPQLVRSWMAHHQGMSLLALTNLLCNNVFQHWFHANPRVRAAELLLHERPLSDETLKALASQPKQPSPASQPPANPQPPPHPNPASP